MEVSWLYLIPLLPLAGAAVNGLLGRWLPKAWLYAVALVVVLLSFCIGLFAWWQVAHIEGETAQLRQLVFTWFSVGSLRVDLGLTFDRLSGTLVLVVTGVGFLIHLYSVGYMDEDPGYWRYFAYLNLFVSMMLLLVLSDNLVAMFVGWEGVGLCSYLLVGFWYDDDAKAYAGRKAFIVNRIGDFGFLIGIFVLYLYTGQVSFQTLKVAPLSLGVASAAAALLFAGATGKSAQLPLYVWLPDAMAGPTPVSALIHAATMVTAGVYMIARTNALYLMSPQAMMVVAFIGALTALFAATIAVRQNDIKKVLAYSTVSQLGFMFIGVGGGALTAGIFHLVTHAFFKACLFLGSGSVIHAMSGEQDIRKMGGLWKKISITAWTFLIATIAIAGFPPLSGSFSKDEILVSALTTPYLPLNFDRLIWFMATVAALFTAYYMFRLFFLTFTGKFRGTHEQEHHIHESPPTMTIPLVVLAALSIIGGALGIPAAMGEHVHMRHLLAGWLGPVYARGAAFEVPARVEWFVMLISTAVAVFGAWLSYNRFFKTGLAADAELAKATPALARALENKYYVDEFYDDTVVTLLEGFSRFLWRGIDAIIDGLLALAGYAIALLGDLLRFFQTGNVRNYALMFFIGVIVFLWVLA